ncbi:MAG: hypothetical protein ACLTDT_10260 [Clostridium sp.]
MTKSKVFILAVIVFFIIMGGLYFLLPKEEKQGGVLFHKRPVVYRNRRIRMMKHLVL